MRLNKLNDMSEVKEEKLRHSLDEMTIELLEAGYTHCSNKVLNRALSTLRKFDTRYYLEELILNVKVRKDLWFIPCYRFATRNEYRILRRSASGDVISVKLRSVENGAMREILTAEEANAWLQGKIFDLKPSAKRVAEIKK